MTAHVDLPLRIESPADLRRERLLDVLRDGEFLSVAELGEALGVSRVTVRSDLDALAHRGLVRRVRGGAIARPPRAAEPRASGRAAAPARRDEDEAIARAAAALVEEGDTVLLGAGRTTRGVARVLLDREELRDVTVLTSAPDVALVLAPAIPRLTVVMLGGTLRAPGHTVGDPLGGFLLDQLNPHIVLLEADGVDARAGVTDADLAVLGFKQRMLHAGARRVVLAPPQARGAVHHPRVCGNEDVHHLVTAPGAGRLPLEELRERGLDVLVAGADDA